MTSLAWSLKAWLALSIPADDENDDGGHRKDVEEVLRMEFRTFVNNLMRIPTQILKTGRRVIFRLMGWNPWQHVFFRFLDALE